MRSLHDLLRPNIAQLKPYSSARDEYSGTEGIFLDANENPIGSLAGEGFNRYPDPYQKALKAKIGEVKGIDPAWIFLGNGSDEPIDLLVRATCEPKDDAILITPPTYGMYQVCADVQGARVISVPLTRDFQPDVEAILKAADNSTKLLFLCSPNNPTGNLLDADKVMRLIQEFDGLVVLDEAYADFAPEETSLLPRLAEFPNLVILHTFSKAWGLAALRLGMAFAQPKLIEVLSKIKYPYNINLATQRLAMNALGRVAEKDQMVEDILSERERLAGELSKLPLVEHIYPTAANFLLIRVKEAGSVFEKLLAQKIIVRDRSRVILCEGCLRITVGTKAENDQLLATLSGL